MVAATSASVGSDGIAPRRETVRAAVVGKAQGILGGQAAADRHAERADERIARCGRIDGLDAGDGRTEHEPAVLHEGRTGRADGDEQLFHALFAELRGGGGTEASSTWLPSWPMATPLRSRASCSFGERYVKQASSSSGSGALGAGFSMTGTPLSWAYFATIVLISIGISELEHDEVEFGDAVLQKGDVLRRDGHVRAGHDENAVLGAAVRLLLEDDDGAAGGRAVVIEDAGDVSMPASSQVRRISSPFASWPELAAHRDLRAEAGHLHSLIGALAAGSLVEALGEDRLAPDAGRRAS